MKLYNKLLNFYSCQNILLSLYLSLTNNFVAKFLFSLGFKEWPYLVILSFNSKHVIFLYQKNDSENPLGKIRFTKLYSCSIYKQLVDVEFTNKILHPSFKKCIKSFCRHNPPPATTNKILRQWVQYQVNQTNSAEFCAIQ